VSRSIISLKHVIPLADYCYCKSRYVRALSHGYMSALSQGYNESIVSGLYECIVSGL